MSVTEVVITCPNCSKPFPLTASLAAPLLEIERAKHKQELELQVNNRVQQERVSIASQATTQAKQQYEAELKSAHHAIAEKDRKLAEAREQEVTLRRERQQLSEQKAELEQTINRRLDEERERIRAEQAEKSHKEMSAQLKALQNDLASKDQQLAEARKNELDIRREREQLVQAQRDFDLTIQQRLDQEREKIRADQTEKVRKEIGLQLEAAQREIESKEAQLDEARKQELELRRERQKLADEKEQLDLTVQRRIDEERNTVREQTRRDADEQFRLKLAEKDKVITDTQKQLDEANRKIAQGSQQLQGDVGEEDLESLLRGAFPRDEVKSPGKGREGADRLLIVSAPDGQSCGQIYFERKRTKAWANEWLEKARDDQRRVQANLVVIVTDSLPKGVSTFTRVDGVWVTSPRCCIPLTMALRQGLVECGQARLAIQGRSEKESLVYAHVNSPEFIQQVGLMVEAILSLRQQHEKEKTAMNRIWAERDKQYDRLLRGTASIYGGIRGIVGGTLPPIHGLALPEPKDLLAVQTIEEKPVDSPARSLN